MLNWLQSLLSEYGYGALFLALFVNNAGIPFPANSLLLAAGVGAGKGLLSPGVTALTAAFACFLGTNFGYWLGHRYGLNLLKRVRWLRLTHRRVQHLEKFFRRYGPRGVFFARFVTLLHPLIGLMSGAGKTPRGPFLLYNLAGSAAYSLLYTLAGYWLGGKIGLHTLWVVHITGYLLVLLIVAALLVFFWRYSIHSFLGFTYFRKK
ncbi:MAG TPA: DedA family protein [bacterium]|nr:DedA family protein [bacterium]